MGDPMQRKHSTLNRLRQQLRKKKESLADQFEFKMYMIFHFKDQAKVTPVISQVTCIVLVMQYTRIRDKVSFSKSYVLT